MPRKAALVRTSRSKRHLLLLDSAILQYSAIAYSWRTSVEAFALDAVLLCRDESLGPGAVEAK